MGQLSNSISLPLKVCWHCFGSNIKCEKTHSFSLGNYVWPMKKGLKKLQFMTFAKMCRTPLIIRHFPETRSCAALRTADLVLSGQDAFRGRTFGRFPASLFSPLALSSNWILILIQLLQVKDRQNVTHKQTDTVSKVAHFCDSHRAPADLPK